MLCKCGVHNRHHSWGTEILPFRSTLSKRVRLFWSFAMLFICNVVFHWCGFVYHNCVYSILPHILFYTAPHLCVYSILPHIFVFILYCPTSYSILPHIFVFILYCPTSLPLFYTAPHLCVYSILLYIFSVWKSILWYHRPISILHKPHCTVNTIFWHRPAWFLKRHCLQKSLKIPMG
jgi:hypothetical protein